MRCVQCDANDMGLSNFHPEDEHPVSFHVTPNGDCLCNVCLSWNDELTADYYDMEEEDE